MPRSCGLGYGLRVITTGWVITTGTVARREVHSGCALVTVHMNAWDGICFRLARRKATRSWTASSSSGVGREASRVRQSPRGS